LENFNGNDLVLAIAKFCVGIIVMFSYPLVLFICRNSIEVIFFAKFKENTIRRLLITGGLCLCVYLIAMFVNDLAIVIGLINTTAGAVINYIYPISAYIALEKRWSRKIPAIFLGIFCFLISFICFSLVVLDIITRISGIKSPI
jgi:solute carrier family 38 (sodium-coupled neutral amino acid transporter), member 11